LGGANSATPTDYTLNVNGARSGSDTDLTGGALQLGPGNSTGAATPPTFTINGKVVGSAGTTAQNTVPRVVTGMRKALTSGSATTLVSSQSNSDVPVVGVLKFGMIATDTAAHNNCFLSGIVPYGAENSNGTQKGIPSATAAPTLANACTGSQTLTATFTATNANP